MNDLLESTDLGVPDFIGKDGHALYFVVNREAGGKSDGFPFLIPPRQFRPIAQQSSWTGLRDQLFQDRHALKKVTGPDKSNQFGDEDMFSGF